MPETAPKGWYTKDTPLQDRMPTLSKTYSTGSWNTLQ